MLKKVFFWFIAVVITLSVAIYQRLTGPTYPYKGKVLIDGKTIEFKLPRSIEIGSYTKIVVPYLKDYKAFISYKRYKTNDSLTVAELNKEQDNYFIILPDLPPAGKYTYSVFYSNENKTIFLNEKDIIVRYKGKVPSVILILHILFMFGAMVFSNYTGIISLLKSDASYKWALVSVITLIIGGFILGPLMQKYAFNVYWSGFPFDYDLTDNKTLISFLLWLIAIIFYRKNKNTKWFLIASILTLTVYLIPHSIYGSELDFSTGQIKHG
jgi:hypothetical protein